jgi:secreted PhoX family phosphatase
LHSCHICTDGEDDQWLVGVNDAGEVFPFAYNGLSDSEFAGATFSPDGQTLFVNIQSDGLTLAIWGPWPPGRLRLSRDGERQVALTSPSIARS